MTINVSKIVEPASVLRFLSLTIANIALSEMDRSVQVVLSRIAGERFQRSSGDLDLSRIYELEPPVGGAHLFKMLIYSPEALSGHTVLITNLADGWNSLSHLLAKEHAAYQIQITSTKGDVEFPQNRLEVWDDGVSKRIVMVMRDSDEWTFFQKGLPGPFERVEFYKEKMKKNRFNREIILNYMNLLGYNLLDSSFWGATGETIYYEEQCRCIATHTAVSSIDTSSPAK